MKRIAGIVILALLSISGCDDEVVVERSKPEDTIWISPLGGTTVNELDFGRAFTSILPKVTYLEFKTYKDLVLHTTDRKSQISLNKYE